MTADPPSLDDAIPLPWSGRAGRLRRVSPQPDPSITCLVCAEQTGAVDLPGGLLDDGSVLTFHVPPLDERPVYAGHLLVTPRRHAADFAALDSDEAAGVGIAICRYSRALKSLGARHVYLATIGHRVEHLHVHLLPRWPETPEHVAWNEIDEWDGARQVGPSEIEQLMDDLRRALR